MCSLLQSSAEFSAEFERVGRSSGEGPVGTRVLFPNRKPVTAALRYRYTGPVRPVTGGNRLNSNPNSNKFKFSRATGSDRFTGRFYRFTGRFDRFDRWAFMGRPIFFLFLF